MTALYVILAILAFGVMILLHELGHFLTARAFGVTVKEFSIGMGPAFLSHTSKKSGIVYKLSLLPIGEGFPKCPLCAASLSFSHRLHETLPDNSEKQPSPFLIR